MTIMQHRLAHLLPVWQRILKLALPSIATFSSMTFTGMLTLTIVGRLGPIAIAVVGVSNIILYNVWALFAGINESVNYLVSQNFGENTMPEGNARMQIALVLSLGCAVLLGLCGVFFPDDILRLLGASDGLRQVGTSYLRLRLFAFLFSLFTNVFFAYMRGVGDTRTPMFISFVTNAALVGLTLVLTYGFAFFPKLGLAGAGWSMIITEALGCTVSALLYFGQYHRTFATRHWHRVTARQIAMMARESVKLSVMELSMSLGMIVFTACITRLGTTALAANEIALNILSFGFMPSNGFGAAATILVGQSVGAGLPQEARRMGQQTVLLGVLFMALFSILLLSFGRVVASLYTSDPVVAGLAVSLTHIAAFIQLFDGAGIVLAGALRGVGDTSYLFRISLALNWIVFIPLTVLLTVVWHYGQVGAWISLCTLLVCIAVTNGWRYIALPWNTLVTASATLNHGV